MIFLMGLREPSFVETNTSHMLLVGLIGTDSLSTYLKLHINITIHWYRYEVIVITSHLLMTTDASKHEYAKIFYNWRNSLVAKSEEFLKLQTAYNSEISMFQ